MRQTILSLILIADVFVCPYACNGSLWTSGCSDSCCPPKEGDSGSDVPEDRQNSCDGSCGSCLCGGAVTTDQTLTSQDMRPDVCSDWFISTDDGLSPFTAQLALDDEREHTPNSQTGIALRALLQSFLL